MTLSEFAYEFDVEYHGIAGVAAPPMNAYEKSVMLTRAQEELVKEAYDRDKNPEGDGYQTEEYQRRLLEFLTYKGTSLTSFTSPSNSMATRHRFFEIEDSTMFITQEQIRIQSSDACLNGNYIKVTPITDDEYQVDKDNPFKNPDDNNAWRADIRELNNAKVIEIIYGPNYTPIEYHYRYVKYPAPIILEDLTSLGRTINGQTAASECELPESFHRDVIRRAVFRTMQIAADPRVGSGA